MENAKSRVVYILLALFLGGIGIHNFYAGHTKNALIQLILGVVGLTFISAIWALVDIFRVKEDANGVAFK